MDSLSILYLVKFYFPLSVLIIILFYFTRRSPLQKDLRPAGVSPQRTPASLDQLVKYGILLTVIIILSISVYSTVLTYSVWQQDPISKFLLPPHDSSYFYQYSYFHYWRSCLAIFILSAVWTSFLLSLFKYSKERILNKNEIYLGLFTSLSVGFPLFIPYIFLLFLIFLLHQIINNFILKKSQPISISLSMILSAIIVLLLGDTILIKFGLDVLRV